MLFRSKKRRDRPRTAPAQLLPVTGARDIARVHAICETRNDQGRAIMIVLATAIGAPAFAAAMTSRLASRPRDRALRKQRLVAISRSEEHTSELQSLMPISYAVFRLKKKINTPHSSCPLHPIC